MARRNILLEAYLRAYHSDYPLRRFRLTAGVCVVVLIVFSLWITYVGMPVGEGLLHWGVTTATITDTDSSVPGKGVKVINQCFLRYTFTVDQEVYEGPSTMWLRFPHDCPEIGSSIDIRYFTGNPAHNIWALHYNLTLKTVIFSIIFVYTLMLLTKFFRGTLGKRDPQQPGYPPENPPASGPAVEIF